MTKLTYIILCAATAVLARSEPPALAPFYGDGHPDYALIKEQYSIKLSKGSTLEAYFDRIGVNLSSMSSLFSYHNGLHRYRVYVNEDVIHKRIKYDPGIEWVSQDRGFDLTKDWENERVLPGAPNLPPSSPKTIQVL
ncbi:hypothetical protein BCR34DRAFT_583549 [Clohesyomyces aquaticus]|uniref:Uncharacterized protein n=1 Tax=Clohesyomyces aquaticus TaxID=1231657 RepID=A0A1Y2A5U0_9PLEO|nr:hypothetical protein BCR34DRAFT_583549 [Clohesyomyces aquaticus]